jgi:hypothetical protein
LPLSTIWHTRHVWGEMTKDDMMMASGKIPDKAERRQDQV